jgi:hypothetical protein
MLYNSCTGIYRFGNNTSRPLRGRPKLRLEDGVVEDMAKLGCKNWKVVALNREGWRKLMKEAEAQPGL